MTPVLAAAWRFWRFPVNRIRPGGFQIGTAGQRRMTAIATDPSPDATLALLRDGYGFVSRRCARLGADAFRTRLMLRPVLCARGSAAAKAFYTPDRFTRAGGMPAVTMRLLQDRESVQLLDGPAHRHRKAMFLRMLHDDAQVARLSALIREELVAAIPHWTLHQPVELVAAMAEVLTRAAFRWTGIPLTDPPRATRDLTAMIRNAGRFGPRSWRALKLRDRHEREMQAVIRDIRSGALGLDQDRPARVVAGHRDLSGEVLSEAAAAVELINLTRPIVAVAWLTGFAALALAAHPDRRASPCFRHQPETEPVHGVARLRPAADVRLGVRHGADAPVADVLQEGRFVEQPENELRIRLVQLPQRQPVGREPEAPGRRFPGHGGVSAGSRSR